MKALLQRVSKASVTDHAGVIRSISRGLLVFVGIESDDSHKDCEFLLDKIINLRIFDDKEGKLNLSLTDLQGDLMLVSQFTLLADTRKGRRPSFHLAGDPKTSEKLFDQFVDMAKSKVKNMQKGWFGKKMSVELINDGPVTIILDSRNKE